MAITTRYFSTAAAGAGDGTTWANRAALFDGSGNWSTVITGFDFDANAMNALVGPGTYTCAQLLQGTTFTVAQPTIANTLIFQACDGSGNVLTVPSPGWTSARPVWDTSNMPVISATTNVSFCSVNACWRLMAFTTSARNGIVFSSGGFDWCVITNSTNGTASVALSGVARVSNSVIKMTGSAFEAAIVASTACTISNVRLEGNSSATSGNRRGLSHAVTGAQVDRFVATGFAGGGCVSTSTNTAHWIGMRRFVLVANGGTAYTGHSTASQTAVSFLESGIITDNGGYGVNAGAEGVYASRVHLRDNTSGNFTALGNWPTDLCDTDTSYGGSQAARQAALFVDYASGDFRIKRTSAYWGKGYGVEDEPAVLASDAGKIISGNTLGGVSGTYVEADVDNIRAGVTYGAGGGFEGSLVVPVESDVKSGVGYGAEGTEFTGSYAGGGGGGTSRARIVGGS